MKLFADFLPVVLFFAVYKIQGIYAATAAAIAAGLLQAAYSYARTGTVDTMLKLSLGILVVFGGSTLLFHNEAYIKWKPTVLYWGFALAIAGGRLLFKHNAIRGLIGKQLALPDPLWEKLNAAWAIFFALLGWLNLHVAWHYSTASWVNFKLFGILGCMLAFLLAQSFFLGRYLKAGPGPHN
ncbi:MAG TPA: septation protein A [Elusimicrobiales bacterium]|nr:septation protein A [Elusimicrobiales bacterium]